MRRRSQPTDVTDLLPRGLGVAGTPLGRVLADWEAVCGRYVARHCLPTNLDQGVLSVRCATAAWTSELLHLSAELLPRLAERMGSRAPRRIRPYTGRLPATAAVDEQPPPQPTPPDRATIERAHQLAASITDDALRASVVRAICATLPRPAPPPR